MSQALRLRLTCILTALICAWTAMALVLAQTELGNRLQIALPAVGAACAAGSGNLGEFTLRLAGTLALVHGLKAGLGEAPVNRRPNGHGRGFPSGHTAAASFGAAAILRDCAGLVPYLGPAATLAAGFVGGSRVQAGQHSLSQVMVGALIGLMFDLGFRSAGSRSWAARMAREAMRAARALRWSLMRSAARGRRRYQIAGGATRRRSRLSN